MVYKLCSYVGLAIDMFYHGIAGDAEVIMEDPKLEICVFLFFPQKYHGLGIIGRSESILNTIFHIFFCLIILKLE